MSEAGENKPNESKKAEIFVSESECDQDLGGGLEGLHCYKRFWDFQKGMLGLISSERTMVKERTGLGSPV